MKRAGCWEISFGLESGSDELLKSMDKVAHVAKSEEAVGWTAAAGIRPKGLFMLGYPGESEETIQATKDFIRRIPMSIMNLTKFTPYPGSPLYRELYGTYIRDDHWQKMNGMNFLWAPEGLTVDELDRHYQAVLRGFYQRPRMVWYYLKLTVGHPAHLVRLCRLLTGWLLARMRSLLGGGGLLLRRDQVHLDHAE